MLHSFFENPDHVSVFALDSHYCYTGFNETHREEMLTVFGAQVTLGSCILKFLPTEDGSDLQRLFARALKGETFSVTEQYRGEYYLKVFNPLYGDINKVIGVNCNFLNVTDRVLAEQQIEAYRDELEELLDARTKEIKAQSSFYQAVFDGLPNLIFVRNEEHKYVVVNKALAEAMGVAPDQVKGKSISIIHEDKAEAIRYEKEDKHVLATGEVLEDEFIYTYPDGSSKWLLLSKRRMVLDNEKYVLGVHFDITTMKKSEHRILKANQDLTDTLSRLKSTQMRLIESEKMASLGQLTAGLAHEINNPINYVSGNVEPIKKDLSELNQMLDKASQELNYEGKRFALRYQWLFRELDALLEGVKEGTTRVKNLMSDLNSFSLPQTAQRYNHDINESITATLNLIRHHIKDRIFLDVSLGDVPSVSGNPSQLNQVFLNVMNNAIQAIDDKGEIKVSTGVEEDWVCITIEDTGHGIAKAHLGRIFDPFFTTKDVGQGTGLGLAISYRIIKDHLGSIEVNSEKLVGTIFKIKLPIG